MRKYINLLSYFLVVGMIHVAKKGIMPDCWFGHYQTEVPKSLRR